MHICRLGAVWVVHTPNETDPSSRELESGGASTDKNTKHGSPGIKSLMLP
jgi:hypothetical protein